MLSSPKYENYSFPQRAKFKPYLYVTYHTITVSVIWISEIKLIICIKMLFNKTRQYNIHIFNKIIFFSYRTKQIKTTETNKVTYLNWNGSLTKKDNFIEYLYIVLSCLIK